MRRLVIQNLAVLASLIVGQIAVVWVLLRIPGNLVDLGWIWRLILFAIVYVAIGAVAFHFYFGSRFTRYVFVGVTPPLTVLASLATIPTDPAYPYAELQLIIPMTALALFGAYIWDRVVPKQIERRRTTSD